jgi:hypothetical protein
MLSIRDHMALQLAGETFRYPAVRETRALDELGYTPTRYWQRVDWLIGQPEAEVAYPGVVRRLRRLRDARARQRSTSPATTFA